MFKYGETQSEAVKLLIFPYSLSDKAKTWFNELNEESITSWEQMRKAFINRFFPPSLFNRLLLEIRNFSQNICESLTEAWLRLKNMLRKCHGHGLTKGVIIQIFYHGLDEPTQAILDVTAGGIFLYKSPNQAFQLLEDKMCTYGLYRLFWSIGIGIKLYEWASNLVAPELVLDHHLLDRSEHSLLVLRPPKYPKSKKNVLDEEEVLGQP
ncbi:reverse transcriptase domain-containing protein [Tanacetum coccineum]